MKQKLTQRLNSLQTEFEAGQKLLAEYETKQQNLRETILRISGAIILLQEMIAEADSEGNGTVSESAVSAEEIIPLAELVATGEGK